MSDIDDLKRRMAVVEATVAEQSRLRAAVDSDQADMSSKVRAMHHLVQALSITQSEHTDRLARIETSLSELRDSTNSRLDVIVGLLSQLIERES